MIFGTIQKMVVGGSYRFVGELPIMPVHMDDLPLAPIHAAIDRVRDAEFTVLEVRRTQRTETLWFKVRMGSLSGWINSIALLRCDILEGVA